MNQPLRLLLAEDSPADAELILHELRQAGYEPDWQRVDSEAEYLRALRPDLDVILSDYNMPQFDGPRALELLKARGWDVPFIIISGNVGEDAAVAAMKDGAADYLLKDRLARLGEAVSRALEQARLRREHKRDVEELRLFRSLVDQANDTFEIIDPETSRFLDVNEKGPAELGYTRAELLALGVIDIDPTVSASSWPLMSEKIRTAGFVRGEGFHRRKDGTTFPIEFNARWVRLDRDYIVVAVRDITERKEAEEALRASEKKFRGLFEGTRDAIMTIQPSGGRFTSGNPAAVKMFGAKDEEEFLTHGPVDSSPPRQPDGTESAAKAQAMLATALREGSNYFEWTHRRMDGSEFPADVLLTRVEQGENAIIHATIRDLTARKQLEQQFLRAQRMESIGTLAGGISHDLNNSLAPIIMSLDLLKAKFLDPASQELLAIIGSSAQRGVDMVRQVLSFGRGVEGRRMEVQVNHLVREIEKIVTDTFLKNIRIGIFLPKDLWTVLGDPTQIQQVLLNLSVNARDAMPSGGSITITAENLILDAHYAAMNPEAEPGPYVRLELKDSGIGMSPQVMELIFDPFFTTKEIGQGTGLGLSTSLGIVKSHGGFIKVTSELGKGTKFHVYLPAQTEPSPATAAARAAEMPRGHGELVLVIDDEPGVRQITQRTLEAFGYRVVLASDGAEAVLLFVRRPTEFAIVLTDMMMPGMDGPTTIQVLRKIHPAVRVIAASGLAANGEAARAASLGVKHFLLKPYTAATLLKTLRESLDEK